MDEERTSTRISTKEQALKCLEILGLKEEDIGEAKKIERQWKILSLKYHPDRGGSNEKMSEINDAHDKIKKLTKREFFNLPNSSYSSRSQNSNYQRRYYQEYQNNNQGQNWNQQNWNQQNWNQRKNKKRKLSDIENIFVSLIFLIRILKILLLIKSNHSEEVPRSRTRTEVDKSKKKSVIDVFINLVIFIIFVIISFLSLSYLY